MYTTSNYKIGLILFLLIFQTHIFQAQNQEGRTVLNIDKDWKFAFGHAANAEKDFNYGIMPMLKKAGEVAFTAADPKFDDSQWRSLDLPHDWAVELPFEYADDPMVMSHGYKPVGGRYPETSIGWYRKSFTVDSGFKGKRFELQFDGIFRDAEVWINGFYLGNNESGYIGMNYDITDFLKYNEANTIAVRVDATQYEGWFYEGAGIYRHVWLNSFNPLHIDHDGIYSSAKVDGKNATINVETTLVNDGTSEEKGSINVYLTDRNGKVLSTTETHNFAIPVNGKNVSIHQLSIDNVRLWTLEDPYLHRIHVEIIKNNKVVDKKVQKFGVRDIRVETDGLYLNGKKIKIQGVNCHQDHAGVGSALPDYLQYYRIKLLKNLGVNAYRASHNPATPELLDACDSLGMLVMAEPRLLNSGKEHMDQFERFLKRDRSRTCIFMWCIGNEEGWIHTTDIGKNIALTFLQKQKELDPGRISTYAADLPNVYKGINEVVPVRSFNYRHFAVEEYHRDHPDQPIIGTEMGSTVTTRGIYERDSIRGYVPDQDISHPWWASTAEAWWPLAAENDFWLGGFVWTGLDYRGEPTPWQWPNINSHFGIMDMAGFPKNIYYYYQSWWTDKDVLHISPHWNWQGKRNEPVEVWVNSNAQEVELYLNDESLGKKEMPRNSHLKWTVNYIPGKLTAVATKNGKTFSKSIETTGVPTELILTPYKTTMIADGMDATVINITALDEKGRVVPNANNMVTFHIEGDAKIIGVGNGDPSSHEPDKCEDGRWQRSLFNGHCQIIIQAGSSADKIHFEARSPNLWTGSTDIHTVSPGSVASVTIDPKYILKGEAAKPRPVDKMLGADISFLPQLEARGIEFKDKGVKGDAIEILQNHGFNYVRLRIFNDPAREGGYAPGKGFCDLSHTLEMARRAKAAGMKILLDFHYSDYWADPGKQYKPQAWEGLGFEDLKKALYDYTYDVVKQLKDQGTSPDMVQIGNEINHGIVWPEGHVSHLDSLAQLINAGTAAVKAVDPEVVMMLHVALGGQNDESVFFIDEMIKRKVPFDVIGESYYPKWHGTLDDLRDNLHDLVRRYNKDIILVEYSAKKEEIHKIVFDLPDGRGKGTCIWEPLNTWESVFDREGNSNEYLEMYDVFKQKYYKE